MKTRTINFKIMHKKTPIRLIDWSFSSLSLLCNWIDAYFLAIPTEALKLDHSVDFSKQRIVSTTANIFTRIYFRTALAEENRSTGYKLTVPSLAPSRFDCESRPFLELPAPFFCAKNCKSKRSILSHLLFIFYCDERIIVTFNRL